MNEDIDAVIKAAMLVMEAETEKKLRESGALPLGEIRALLAVSDLTRKIRTDKGCWIGEINSYRGYYNQPAVAPSDEEGTVADFMAELDKALSGHVYTGYKGGHYTYTRSHPLFVAAYGEASGTGVIGVDAESDECVILMTGIIDSLYDD